MGFNPLEKTMAPLLRRTLDAYSRRHAAVAENIANVETKSYRPLKVDFERDLQRALEKNRPIGKTSDPRHIEIGQEKQSIRAKITEVEEPVNIEQEMALLAQNQIKFDFVARMLRGGYDSIKTSIRGSLYYVIADMSF